MVPYYVLRVYCIARIVGGGGGAGRCATARDLAGLRPAMLNTTAVVFMLKIRVLWVFWGETPVFFE